MDKTIKNSIKYGAAFDWSDGDVYKWLYDNRKMSVREVYNRHLAGIIKKRNDIESLQTIFAWLTRLSYLGVPLRINLFVIVKYLFKKSI